MRFLCFLPLLACAPPDLAVQVPWIELDIDALEILEADPREPTLASFHVHNTGTGTSTLKVQAASPFVALTQRVAIPAGSTAPITIQFRPIDDQPVDGVIELSTGYDTLELPVYATVAPDLPEAP